MFFKWKWVPFVAFALIVIGGFIYWDFTRDKSSASRLAFEERKKITEQLETDQKTLAAQIQELLKQSHCKSDGDCKASGLGAKVCNGYRAFIYYSRTNPHLYELEQYIQKFNQNAAKLSDLSLKVPACGVEAPQVRCIEEQCVPIEPAKP